MPPRRTARTRTGDGHSQPNMYFGAAIFRQLATTQLQELCRRNGLSTLGRRKPLENRLKTADIAPAATPNDQPVNRQLPSTGLPFSSARIPTHSRRTNHRNQATGSRLRRSHSQRHRQGGRSCSHRSFAVTGTVFFIDDSISPGREPRYSWGCCHFRPTGTATALTNFTESTTKRWVAHINAMPSWSTFSGDSDELRWRNPPFPNLEVSPIGLVPKKHSTSTKFRTIFHLSFPNSGVTSINYSIYSTRLAQDTVN